MTGRTRGLLIALAAVAVVAIAIWQWRKRAGDDAPASGAATGTGGAVPPPIDRRRVVAQPAGPSDDLSDPDAPDRSARREPKIYVLDNGAVIRDHRGEGFPPPIAPPPLPPEQRTMNTQLTAKIYLALAPVVRACAAEVPAVDRGDDPFTYVTMTVQVSKGQLTTSDVFPTTHDVKGASEQRFASCVADKGRAIAVAAPDEPDHTDYIVQYPIRLR
jgi:hypothetical protein